MSYRVRIESFEGPFDLLLYLVSRQKVSIGSISLSEITDQYLAEVQRMRNVDLDVASDFLLVASTLLEIKAASLLPHEEAEDVPEEYEEMSASEMRDALVEHLLEYKKFKNAAAALQGRFEAESVFIRAPLVLIVSFSHWCRITWVTLKSTVWVSCARAVLPVAMCFCWNLSISQQR